MKFFNQVFKSITVIATFVIVLNLFGGIVSFIFYDNLFGNFYFQIWISLFKEIMDFNFFDFFFDFKAWIREFLYLLFIISHFLLFSFFSKISFLILFFPKKYLRLLIDFFQLTTKMLNQNEN